MGRKTATISRHGAKQRPTDDVGGQRRILSSLWTKKTRIIILHQLKCRLVMTCRANFTIRHPHTTSISPFSILPRAFTCPFFFRRDFIDTDAEIELTDDLQVVSCSAWTSSAIYFMSASLQLSLSCKRTQKNSSRRKCERG